MIRDEGNTQLFIHLLFNCKEGALLLALALCLLCFSFLYGEDLKELLARHAEGASRLIANTYSNNIIQNEQSTVPPSGKVSKSRWLN